MQLRSQDRELVELDDSSQSYKPSLCRRKAAPEKLFNYISVSCSLVSIDRNVHSSLSEFPHLRVPTSRQATQITLLRSQPRRALTPMPLSVGPRKRLDEGLAERAALVMILQVRST